MNKKRIMERGERYKIKYTKIVTAAILLALCCLNPSFADGDINDMFYEINKAFSIKLDQPQHMEIMTITKHRADPNVINDIEKSFNIQSSYINDTPQKSATENPIPHDVENGISPVNDFFSPVPDSVRKATEQPTFTETPRTNALTPLQDIIGDDTNICEPPPTDAISSEVEEESTYPAAAEEDLAAYFEGKKISGITIDGLKTLNESVVLNAIRTKKGKPFHEALLQQDLQRIYATGYFQDKMEVNPMLNEDGTVDLVYVVKENPIVRDVAVVGNTVIGTSELLHYLQPLKGLPQNVGNINKAIDDITEYYKDQGYILAGVLDVNDDENGVLTFTITEGVINKFILEGNEKTRDYVITRNMVTQPGTVYNENYLKEDIAKLYSTNLFKDVNREIIPVEDGEFGQYDVKISVKEASSNSISIGMGLDSGLGVFGSLGLNENNFMGKGQKISLTGLIGSGILLSDASIKNRINYQTELSFFEPHFINADNSFLAKMYLRELGSFQVPLAIERRIGGMIYVDHKFSKYDNLSSSLGLGYENIHLKEGDFNRIARMYALSNINIARRRGELTGGNFINLAPSIKYDTLDDHEIPREGLIAQAKFIEAFSLSNMHNTNGRLAGNVTKYIPILEKSSLSVTGRAGVKVHGDRMPEVMSFSLGGPYSVRGFKMSGVGSGDGFVMGSVELATPIPFFDKLKYEFFHKMRLNFFVDAGAVFDGTISSKLYDRPMHAISGGVGIKVFIPKIGQISVDYGIPFTHTGKYGPKHGYFTFGTGADNWYGY